MTKLPVSACCSGNDDGLSQSGEAKRDDGRRSASLSDPVETLNAFTRKIGAFVNKPSTQVKYTHRNLFLLAGVGDTVLCSCIVCGRVFFAKSVCGCVFR